MFNPPAAETLKALGELRKTVIDETQRVTQKTQDLTAALWRDLAVAAAPFVMKVLGDAGSITSPTIAGGLYFGSAAFITLSFVLQWQINRAYFEIQTDSRAAWLHTLYNYVSPQERNEIADTPIEEAMKNYRETRAILLLIYVLLVALLVGFGIYTLRHSLAAPPSNSAPIAKPAAAPRPTISPEKPIPSVCVPSAKVQCPKDAN